MIELTVRLTGEQLVEIAERAAALIPTGAPAVSPWLNVAEAAERLRCRKDRIYDLISLGKLHPRREGAAFYYTATISTATSKDGLHDLPVVGVTRWFWRSCSSIALASC
jgi:helix-turn-helix protein